MTGGSSVRGYIILLLQVFFYGTKMERKFKNTSSCGRIRAGDYIWEPAGHCYDPGCRQRWLSDGAGSDRKF